MKRGILTCDQCSVTSDGLSHNEKSPRHHTEGFPVVGVVRGEASATNEILSHECWYVNR